MKPPLFSRSRWGLPWLAALLLSWAAGAAFAQQQLDPPARVAHLSYREGSVVFAPEGEDEWVDLPGNRPLTLGDRLWTDRGSRAELQLGTSTLHMSGETHLGISALDDRAAQFIVQQGSVNARVRDLQAGENFELDTPNLAFRALQPGDYRVDVAADGSETHVAVRSGTAEVFGQGGQAVRIGAGQQASFGGRDLAQVQDRWPWDDPFGRWAEQRNRVEDQSLSARYVPRGVVGYSDLDPYGTWGQDPSYGAVWYPNVTVADWAPYRYGHWAWIQPWGWTWVDDEPWGFAPFHYGRWTRIGHRWAWVPGRLAPRPVYAPALVEFVGDGNYNGSSGPAVGWYPLAPGEPWWPTYRTSPTYLSWLNFSIDLRSHRRHEEEHYWRRRPDAFTVVREEDFRRGHPVYRNWQRPPERLLNEGRIGFVPPRPPARHERDQREERAQHPAPRLQAAPPAVQPAVPSRQWGAGREFHGLEVPPAGRATPRGVQPLQPQEPEGLLREAQRKAQLQQEQQRQAEERQRLQSEQLRRQQEQQKQLQDRQLQQRQQQERQLQERQQQERARADAIIQRQREEERRRENLPGGVLTVPEPHRPALPPGSAVAPPLQNVAPPVRNAAPQVQNVAPRVQNVAPPARNIAPPVQNVAPQVPPQHVAPPAQHVAPPPPAQHAAPPSSHAAPPAAQHVPPQAGRGQDERREHEGRGPREPREPGEGPGRGRWQRD